jgi:hypothetical protein
MRPGSGGRHQHNNNHYCPASRITFTTLQPHGVHQDDALNPKSEILNIKQYLNPNSLMLETLGFESFDI